MSAPASKQSSSLPGLSSHSSRLASHSSSSQLQLSTSSLAQLPARFASPAAVHSASPESDESLSSDWHNDESPPDDVMRATDESGLLDSMQIITDEQAAEAAAAVQASAAASQRPSSSSKAPAGGSTEPSAPAMSAAPSEDSAAAATTASAAIGALEQHTDSTWLSVIRGVQEKVESKEADRKEESQPQSAAEEQKMAEEKEVAVVQSPALQPAAVNTDATDAAVVADSVVPSEHSESSPTLYSRVSSILSSISSSPVLPGALLSISLLAVGFCLGRAWQRRQYSLAQQQHADAVHSYLIQQNHSNMNSRPFSRGGTGTGPASSGGGLIDTTRRLVSAIMGEQEKEISRWLGLLQDGVLTPVMVRYIQ